MPLTEFEILYWQVVATLPAVPPSRARSLISVLRHHPTDFGQQLVQIIALNAQRHGYTLSAPSTLN